MRQRSVCATIALILVGAPPLAAQQPPAPANRPAAAPNPAVEAAQRAFEALPEAARKAIQDDLIWASNFTATVSGGFGPRTYDAIRAFQADMRVKPDGILTDDSRKMLRDVAARARATAGFTALTDPRSGARLAFPANLLTRSQALPGGTRWSSADGAVVLETAVAQGSAADLPAAFERVLAVPGRKVTYKLLRDDFFVVSGESGARSFYTRYGPGPTSLRGYTLSYPSARSRELERTVIALANSFQPVPGAGPATAASAPSSPAAQTPASASLPATNTLPPGLITTGVVVAPGKVATVAAVTACPDLRVRGKPARIAREAAGVVLLDAETATARPLAAPPASGAEDAFVLLGFVGGGQVPALTVSSGMRAALSDPAKPLRIEAPLHREAAGSLIFTRTGAVVGAIAPTRSAPRLVAGIVPAASHAVVSAPALLAERSQGLATPAAQPMTSGAIVTAYGPSLVAIECAVPTPLR